MRDIILGALARTGALPGPDALIAGWQRLLADGAHLHLPQIAARLAVPEAALLAARVGTGAQRLRPDLARVLAPVCDWHRVLFVASTGLGVLMPMDHVESLVQDSGHLDLAGPAMRVRVDPGAVHEIYIFEDHDPGRGTSKSIQVFDRGGGALLKAVLFHKPSFRAAREWVQDLLHPDQSRDWQAVGPWVAPFAALPATAPEGLWQPFRERIAALAAGGGALTLAAHRPGLDLQWSGRLGGAQRLVGSTLHLHEATLRAHLTLGRAVAGDAGALFVAGQERPALTVRQGGWA